MKKKLLLVLAPMLLASCEQMGIYVDTSGTIIINPSSSVLPDSSDLTRDDSLDISVPESVILRFETFGADVTINDAIVVVGETYNYLPQPVKAGSTFLGWYLNANYQGKEVQADTVITKHSEHTLFARWYQGTDLTIVKSGESIQAAIDLATEGDVLFVKAGLYEEEIIIDKKITLLGNNYLGGTRLEETIITPVSGADFIYTGNGVSVRIVTSDVTFKGFKVDGNNPNYDNIWTFVRQQNYVSTVLAAGNPATGLATINYLEGFINRTLPYDGTIGIKATRQEAIISNLVIAENIVSNYIEYGILVNNNLASTGPADQYAVNIEVYNNHLDHISGLAVLDQGSEGDSYIGGYGRAIGFYRGVSGKIYNNEITNSSLGIDLYYNYKSENEIAVYNNRLIDNEAGIWVNTTGVQKALTIEDNWLEKRVNYQKPLFRPDNTSYALAITGLDKEGLLTVSNNNIINYPVGIVAGSINTEIVYITGNHFTNCATVYHIAEEIFGYNFKNATTNLTIDIDNVYQNCARIYKLDEFNPNRFIIIKNSHEGELISQMLKGKLLAPTVKLSSDKRSVSWSKITNAVKYEIYINEVLIATQEETSFAIPTNYPSVNIAVIALSDPHNNLVLNSDLSVALSLVRNTKTEILRTSLTAFTETTTIVFVNPLVHKLSDFLAATKSGYSTAGWKEAVSEELVTDFTAPVVVDGTYTIEWLKNMTVNYRLGSTIIENETVPVTHFPNLPATLDGQEVLGWYTNSKLTTPYELAPVNATLNLYAKVA